MIERSVDENGEALDPELFKTIDPRIFVMDDGSLFPFLASTPVFPEWPVYSNIGTPRDVIEEVQDALLALDQHEIVGERMHQCYDEFEPEICDAITVEQFNPDYRCDTTKELAAIARQAARAGGYKGFRNPR